MPPLSTQSRLDLINARRDLAQRLKTQFSNVSLTELIRHYNDAVRQVIVPAGEEPRIADPIDLKTERDISDITVNDLPTPDVSEEVDRSITPETLLSAGNLYACYQYDQLGVWEVCQHIYGDFFNGRLRITSDSGAIALYRYEKRKKERFSKMERWITYKRNFNYGPGVAKPGVMVNKDFHRLLANFASPS